ncbi:hypothetical protein OPQ81_011645 [Rhizoctonia solani]|nr:hypothetical protein OPQ81_011645 [Rhizoctonia solani]
MNFAVSDAGGSTVDTTLYSVVSASPTLKLEEKRASSCVQAGAIFVNHGVEEYLRTTLKNARLDPKDIEAYTKAGVKDFESFAKRVFRDETAEYEIHLASGRFNHSAIRTRRGRMKIPGSTIQTFFDTCVDEIKRSVDQQLNGLDVPFIILVGGFGDNEYLQNELMKQFEPRGSNIVLSDESSSKAVADGAVTWGITSNVIARAPRYSFGVMKNAEYDPLLHDRQGRKPFLSPDGTRRVLNGWSEIVHKGITLDSGAVCRKKYCELYLSPTPKLSTFRVALLAYKGDDEPEWVRDERGRKSDKFRTVCTIRANLNDVRGALETEISPSGAKYWKLRFWVCIRFGGTELESYLEWEENGIKRTGPVSMIFPADACLNI